MSSVNNNYHYSVLEHTVVQLHASFRASANNYGVTASALHGQHLEEVYHHLHPRAIQEAVMTPLITTSYLLSLVAKEPRKFPR